ncbi:MAG: succinylglutamate desuccinylase/aspartoacylase family protein, partial [Cyclobacteriaceae bacterium]
MIQHLKDVAANGTSFKRVIGSYSCDLPGPTMLFICSLHGNEPSGLVAFERVIERLSKDQPKLHGRLIGLAGNLAALEQNVRFIDKDLNRAWTSERIQGLANGTIGHSWHLSENTEQKDLMDHMKEIFSNRRGPVYVFDLHTTSSVSEAFISINDTIRNRTFAQHFPIPIILGIEEHLEGTILNYINELGHIAIGIEGGQHQDPASADR